MRSQELCLCKSYAFAGVVPSQGSSLRSSYAYAIAIHTQEVCMRKSSAFAIGMSFVNVINVYQLSVRKVSVVNRTAPSQGSRHNCAYAKSIEHACER